MNVLDFVLLVPLLYAAFKGFTKGFVYEIFSLLALGLGIYGCIAFSGLVTAKLTEYIDPNEDWLPIASYTITFIGIVVLVTMAGNILTRILGVVQLGLANKVMGILFGLVKAAFFVSALLMAFNVVNDALSLLDPQLMEDSLLYEPLSQFLLVIIPESEGNPVFQTFQENFKSLFQQ